MATVEPSNVRFKLARATGPGNSGPSGALGTSLGPFMSTISPGEGDWFPNVSGAENEAEVTEYQVFFVYNNQPNNETGMQSVVVSIDNVPGGTVCALWADPIGAVSATSDDDQSLSVDNINTAPEGSGASDSSLGDFSTEDISLGTIGPRQCAAFWVRRKASNANAVDGDGFTITVNWDTSA